MKLILKKSELLLFKGNDIETAPDRIRLRGANIVFDTYPITTTNRTDENIRMTILSNGNVGIGTTTPNALLDVNGDVLIEGDLIAENLIVGSTNVITEINTKHNIINDDDLTISKILNLQFSLTNLQDNIDLKQNTINDDDLTISKTLNLQSSLTNLQDNIDLNTTNILTKQATITDGSLTIARTNGLQTALDAKQAKITTSTDLTCNQITTELGILASGSLTAGSVIVGSTNIITVSSGKTGFNGIAGIEFKLENITLSNIQASGFKIGASTPAQEALDVAGNILVSGTIIASGVPINAALTDINATLEDILFRLDALENP